MLAAYALVMLERIVEEIETSGPIPFERFMQLALYSPHGGFFTSDRLRSSRDGDFLTSPEVSPWFGRTLARPIADLMRRTRSPFTLVEAGAGSGSLLVPLLDSLPARPERVVAVEASPPARAALAGIADVVEARLPPPFPSGAIVANELLDNLPVAIAVRRAGSWEERWVGVDEGTLVLVEARARGEVIDWADEFGGEPPEGGLVEVQIEAGQWVTEALGRIGTGVLIVVDYGGTTEELGPRRSTGTLRTYRSHHLGPDPLAEPGSTDITVDVNFSAVAAAATAAGASVLLHRQDDYLSEHGLRQHVAELRARELELARAGDEMSRLTVRSELRDAETLLHPRGLGDFRVMVATK